MVVGRIRQYKARHIQGNTVHVHVCVQVYTHSMHITGNSTVSGAICAKNTKRATFVNVEQHLHT